ncbi:MAG: hypothetical protein JST93_32155 [Acidobacteria bacterium]|nr:hypothetical protein [Acidobacteriota bacterium]
MPFAVARLLRLCALRPLFAALIAASLPALLPAQFRFDSWTIENGLPQNSIWALRQTRDGYLWMTTSSSLVRFDGIRFREFNRRNTPGFTADNFVAYALLEDRQGCLWAGSQAGVVRHCNGVFTTFTTKDGLPRNGITRLDEDDQGTVWIYTNPGLSKWKDGRLIRVAPEPGSPFNDFLTASRRRIGIDGYNFGLWKIEKNGWQRFANGRWSNFPLPPGIDPTTLEISSIVEDSRNRLWYRFRNDLTTYYCLHQGRLTTYTGMPRDNFISYQDAAGNIWQSSHAGHANLWTGGRITPLERFRTSYVFRAFEDAEQALWLGTRNAGLLRVSPEWITTVTPRNTVSPELNEISTVLQDHDGSIWYGSNGLFHWSNGQLQVYYHKGATPFLKAGGPVEGAENIVSALFQDGDGTIWAGTWDGLARLSGGYLVSDGPHAAIRGQIAAIHRDRAGVLWVGARRGLYSIHGAVLTHFSAPHGLPPAGVSVIRETRDGALWIGTSAGLFRRTPTGFARALTAPTPGAQHLDDQDITDLYQDSAGVLWIATASYGLYRLENANISHFTESNGLGSSSIFQILEDAGQYFWLSSHAAIHRVRKADLNALAAGAKTPVASTAFGKTDGMNSASHYPYGQPSAIRAADGKLWFATDDGVSVLDPRAAAVNHRQPPVHIEDLTIDGRPSPSNGAITLKPGQLSLDIQYTALSFVKSNQIRFRYRMEGLDPDWIDAGTRRTAYYTRIPPGSYTFRVIAANSDGVWNNQGASLAVQVLPALYQTWWFQLAALLAVAASIAAAWRFRVSQLQRMQSLQQAFSTRLIASQEEERKRIAAELHDSIGQRLVIVKNLALFFLRAQGEEAVSSGKLRPIEEISSEAALAIDETREISYDLRPFQLDRLGLTKAIEGIVRAASSASSMRISQNLDNIDDVFPEELRINFYRIVQESFSNVIHHSQATEVNIRVERAEREVLLTIRDNGLGFTPGAAKSDSERGGFGVTGMAERARSLNGRFSLHSTPGQGTTVSVRIPIPPAQTRAATQ